MRTPPFNAWLRPVLALAVIAGTLSLTACGGGGGTENGGTGPVTPSVVQIFPPTQTIYPGSASTFTVSGGVPPYTAFSSNSAILPIAQSVPNNSVLLFANAVSSSTSVTATVRDSIGQTSTSTIQVAPALLFPNGLTISASDSTCGSGALCTGGTGTVKVSATGVGGTALAGRQIRFDVVYGAFGFLSTNPATPLVQTITVATDTSGVATVGIQALVNVSTQPAQVRATDTTSGQALIGNFTIVRNQDGTSFITVIPATATVAGPDTATCPNGVEIDYRIYGGTPPYRVTSSFPAAVTITGQPVPVSGGYFAAFTNGQYCVNPLTFSILDAAGLQTTATLITTVGTAAPAVPPTPLVVNPTALGDLTTACNTSSSLTIAVSGATPPYNITTLVKPANYDPTGPLYTSQLTTSGTVTFTNMGFTNNTSTGTYKFQVKSADGQTQQVTVTCGPNA